MAIQIHPIETIISDPNVRGGRPIIAGTGVRVSDVVAYYVYGGYTPEQLAVALALDLGQVHAALAYYHLNRQEIDDEMRANDAAADEYLAELEKQGRLIRFE